jgi:hypothetical protein
MRGNASIGCRESAPGQESPVDYETVRPRTYGRYRSRPMGEIPRTLRHIKPVKVCRSFLSPPCHAITDESSCCVLGTVCSIRPFHLASDRKPSARLWQSRRSQYPYSALTCRATLTRKFSARHLINLAILRSSRSTTALPVQPVQHRAQYKGASTSCSLLRTCNNKTAIVAIFPFSIPNATTAEPSPSRLLNSGMTDIAHRTRRYRRPK